MNCLPQEIKHLVLDHLSGADLRSMRLVQRCLSLYATELLFQTVFLIQPSWSVGDEETISEDEYQSDYQDDHYCESESLCSKQINILTNDKLRKVVKRIILGNAPMTLLTDTKILEKMARPVTLDFLFWNDISATHASLTEELVKFCALKVAHWKHTRICVSGSFSIFHKTPHRRLDSIQGMIRDQVCKRFGSCLPSPMHLTLDLETSKSPDDDEYTATDVAEVRGILATMLEYSPDLTLLCLNLPDLEKNQVPERISLHDILFKRQKWNSITRLALGGFYTTGVELTGFLRAHKDTISYLALRNISLKDSGDELRERRVSGPRIGWFETIRFLRNEMNLISCCLSGDLSEDFENGLHWYSDEIRPFHAIDAYPLQAYLGEHIHEQFPNAPLWNCSRCVLEGRHLKHLEEKRHGRSLRTAVHEYILKQSSAWPFPDREWFDQVLSQWDSTGGFCVLWLYGDRPVHPDRRGPSHVYQRDWDSFRPGLDFVFGDFSWQGQDTLWM